MPKWDEAHGGHVLNFHGRVTESSVKNFQLCVQDCEEVSLQFGRVGKHKFTMDVSVRSLELCGQLGGSRGCFNSRCFPAAAPSWRHLGMFS